MMKAFCWVIFFPLLSYGQELSLQLGNPLVRVGEDVELRVFSSDNGVGLGQFSIAGTLVLRQFSNRVESKSIGPFSFTLGGKSLTAQPFTIRVFPDLSKDTLEAVWVTRLAVGKEFYLVVEQRLQTTIINATDKNTLTMSSKNERDFATLDMAKIKNYGISIVSTKTKSANDFHEVEGRRLGFAFRKTIYEYLESDGYVGPFVLTPAEFNDLITETPFVFKWID